MSDPNADSNANTAKQAKPSFFRRIPLAFGAFFRAFSGGDVATGVDGLRQPEAPVAMTPPPTEAPKAPPAPLQELSPDAALQLLSLFQRDARLLDFAMEDLSGYSDADIGSAARVVHEGCRKVVSEHFSIEPVRSETEGSRITLDEGFDAAAIRLTGNVVGKAPFHGSLSHRGWRVTDVRLPKLASGHDATVLAPAEVEL
jgi:hypothetical protein